MQGAAPAARYQEAWGLRQDLVWGLIVAEAESWEVVVWAKPLEGRAAPKAVANSSSPINSRQSFGEHLCGGRGKEEAEAPGKVAGRRGQLRRP